MIGRFLATFFFSLQNRVPEFHHYIYQFRSKAIEEIIEISHIIDRSIVRWQSRRYGIKFCEKKRKKKQIGSYFFLFESKIACTWQLRTKNETNKHRRLMLEIISRWFHSDDDLWIEQESKQSNQALSITFHLDRSYSSIFDMFDCCRFLSKSKRRKNISQVNTMISMIMIGQQDWIWNKQNWCSNIITKNWIDAWITMNWFNDWNQNWWTFFVFFFSFVLYQQKQISSSFSLR